MNCDMMWSRITKEIHRDKHGSICLWCRKKTEDLQSDHIINRWKHSTRWRVENCVCLCAGCHIFRKKRDPLGWAEIVRKEKGEDVIAKLKEMGENEFKVTIPNLEEVYEYLTKLENGKPWRNHD